MPRAASPEAAATSPARRGCARKALAALALALSASVAPAAISGTENVAAAVDGFNSRIIGMLAEKKSEGSLDADSAYGIIREHATERFDFDSITRTTVGKHWQKADNSQRGQVTALFSQLLEKTYAKTLAKFDGQKMELSGSSEREPGKHSVRFTVSQNGKDYKIDYLVSEEGGDWRIFDVKVEGVSLIAGYRGQFSQVIRRDGMDGLIALLRERA